MEKSFQSKTLENLKLKELGEDSNKIIHKKKRKGGPNPLSCLKSKKPKMDNKSTKTKVSLTSVEGKVRKRKRIRKRKNANNVAQ